MEKHSGRFPWGIGDPKNQKREDEEELWKRIISSSDEANKVVDEIGYDRYLEIVKRHRA